MDSRENQPFYNLKILSAFQWGHDFSAMDRERLKEETNR